jgi:hemoglobin
MSRVTLYARVGGHDVVSAIVSGVLPRPRRDPPVVHVRRRRPDDGPKRAMRHLNDLLSSAGVPVYFTGRDIRMSREGTRLGEVDWSAVMKHLHAAWDVFRVQPPVRDEAAAHVNCTKNDMVGTWKASRHDAACNLTCAQSGAGRLVPR